MAKTKALYSNNARTALALPITDTATSLQVVSASRFPVLTDATQYFMATLDDGNVIEIVKVTATIGTTFTVVRAQEGTTAVAFAAATTKFEHRLTADSINRFARLEDRMTDYASVEDLTDPSQLNHNSVMCASIDANGNPIIGTNNGTKWSFVNYPDRIRSSTCGAGVTTTTIPYANANSILLDTAARSYLVQFTSGAHVGKCRFITSVSSGAFGWTTALSSTPGTGDTYEIYRCVSALSYPKGGGSDKVFAENDAFVWSNYTIPLGRNASSAGPVSISSGVTVTISSGSTWTIV